MKKKKQDSKKGGPFTFSLMVVLVLGALIRLRVLGGDFWIDEVWSWELARVAKSVWDIFFDLQHDSNHFLTTLIFYWIDPGAPEWVFRLPSVLAGIASIALAARCGYFYSRTTAVLFSFLVAFAFAFIQYSVEARGYATMLLSALICFCGLIQFIDSNHWSGAWSSSKSFWALVYFVFATLGFLSHLSFLYAFIGFSTWIVFFYLFRKEGQSLLSVLALTLPTSGTLAVLYFTNIRWLKVGGSPPSEFVTSFSQMIANAFGIYSIWAGWIVLFVASMGAILMNVSWKRAEWALFAGLLFGPFALWAVSPSTPPYPRHFISVILFSFLAFSIWAAKPLEKTRSASRFVLLFSLFAWAIAQQVMTLDFWQYRRGNYSEAVRYVLGSKPNGVSTISSDHDFRNRALLRFYAVRLGGLERLSYLPNLMTNDMTPEWYIEHSFDPNPSPQLYIRNPKGEPFDFVGLYRYSGFSGWTWILYKKRT